MVKLSVRASLTLLLCSLLLLHSTPQNEKDHRYALLLHEYVTAQTSYDSATASGDEANYSPDEESRLNKDALNKFQSLEKQLPSIPLYDSLRFFTSFKIGELQHFFDRFTEALLGYRKAIEIKRKSILPDSLLFKPLLYSGIILYQQNKYDSATLFFQQAEIIQSKYNFGIEESERLYNMFGVLHYEKGDYLQAKNYFLKALETLSPDNAYYKALYLNYNINLAQIYVKLEDYGKANQIYQQLLALQPANTNEINHNLGLINLYLGAADKALMYFKRVSYSSNKIIWLYNNTGEAFLHLGRLDSARAYFSKAITTNHELGANTDQNAHGQTLKSFGDLEMKEHNFQSALIYYQKAMHQFHPAYSDTAIASNPQKFSGAFSYIHLFKTLLAKAEALHGLYSQSEATITARQELQTYKSAFALIDYVTRTYNSDEARLFLEKTKHLVHDKPIDIAFELYEKTGDKAFFEDLYFFDQQTKASVLAINAGRAQSHSQNNPVLFNKERSLRSAITRLSLKAVQLTDTVEITKTNVRIRDLEIELGRLQQQFTHTLNSTAIPTVPFLQKDVLDAETAVISFHLSNQKLTTTVITKDNFTCYKQSLYANYPEDIKAYINALKDPAMAGDLKTLSKKLYKLLFAKAGLQNVKRLIIVPDDELNYLSFESLQDDSDHYLLEKFSVQYQYTTALLKKEAIDFRGHQTLSFAPFTSAAFSSAGLRFERLPNSFQEVEEVQGKRMIDSAATKANFLQQFPDYKVIHLATHAIVDPNNDNLSYVAFYPGYNSSRDSFLLYTKEIYNLALDKTRLVILSACETGGGKLVRGEGVMSLSRAFAYAGCANIITSLWNASDFSTAYLTRRIHLYLNKNYPIDEAVRQAKLDYLHDKSINPRIKSPFYWSHLIFIGNATVPARNSYTIYAIAALVIAGLLLWLGINKFRKMKRVSLERESGASSLKG